MFGLGSTRRCRELTCRVQRWQRCAGAYYKVRKKEGVFLALNQLPTGRRGDSKRGNENYYYLYKAHSSLNDTNGDKIRRAASRRKTDFDFALGDVKGAGGSSTRKT